MFRGHRQVQSQAASLHGLLTMRHLNQFFSLAIVFRGAIAASLGLVPCGYLASAETSTSIAVPFIGCAADGQIGSIAAPTTAGAIPTTPASAAGRLAYYASTDLGVLAPRGWHCFALYGSSGSTLLVTPELHDASDLFDPETRLTGPAIELSRTMGGTSGRFGVAKIAARLFPVARPFVELVIDERFIPEEEFPSGPYPNDTLVRISDTEVEYATPANSEGMGTYGRVAKNDQPISGVAILLPAEDMDLIKLDVRLSPEMRDLSPTIIRTIESTQGNLTTDRPK
jgi:hypothetical protein